MMVTLNKYSANGSSIPLSDTCESVGFVVNGRKVEVKVGGDGTLELYSPDGGTLAVMGTGGVNNLRLMVVTDPARRARPDPDGDETPLVPVRRGSSSRRGGG